MKIEQPIFDLTVSCSGFSCLVYSERARQTNYDFSLCLFISPQYRQYCWTNDEWYEEHLISSESNTGDCASATLENSSAAY